MSTAQLMASTGYQAGIMCPTGPTVCSSSAPLAWCLITLCPISHQAWQPWIITCRDPITHTRRLIQRSGRAPTTCTTPQRASPTIRCTPRYLRNTPSPSQITTGRWLRIRGSKNRLSLRNQETSPKCNSAANAAISQCSLSSAAQLIQRSAEFLPTAPCPSWHLRLSGAPWDAWRYQHCCHRHGCQPEIDPKTQTPRNITQKCIGALKKKTHVTKVPNPHLKWMTLIKVKTTYLQVQPSQINYETGLHPVDWLTNWL